ncbi:MAG: hypothetical protein ACFFDN_37715 [Candidatus Hodarchaeota archaeon]
MKKDDNHNIEFEILEYIREMPDGVSIAEISRNLDFSRTSVSKYVAILELKKEIYCKKIGISKIYYSINNDRDPESEILDFIRSMPNGVSLAEISRKKRFSTNTVSLYVSILENKRKIYSKKLGPNQLYYTRISNNTAKKLYISYYKGLLASLKEKFPNEGEIFKDIGRNCFKYLDFSSEYKVSKNLTGVEGNYIIKLFQEKFGKLIRSFDGAEPSIGISFIKKGENRNLLVIQFKDSEYIQNSKDFIYHFYILAGFIEAFCKNLTNNDVICNIESINLSDEKEHSIVELLVELNPKEYLKVEALP